MTRFFQRLGKLIFGLFLYAVGIIFTIHARIGYAPWDVFHVGVSQTTGLTLGRVSMVTGFVVVIFTTLLGEKFGLGTILNMILIGLFVDLIIASKVIPVAGSFGSGLLMLGIGLSVVSVASYFYISSGFGAGPRDGLMVALSRKLKWPVGVCRGILELFVTGAGYFLGGMVGIGTIFYVVLVGVFVQTAFKIFRFDPRTIEHESMKDTMGAWGAFLKAKKSTREKGGIS